MPRIDDKVRCIGLELGGGKSDRTAMVVLDYFPLQQKIFIVAVISQLQGNNQETGDDVLLAEIKRFAPNYIAVNAPLTLPPCFVSCKPHCQGFLKCTKPEVQWMRKEGARWKLTGQKSPTPYTQRPIDIALRGILQQDLPIKIPVDETLGAGPAPLTARVGFLSRRLKNVELLEVNPRLVLARFNQWFGFTVRQLKRYRDMGEGVEQRLQLLRLIEQGQQKAPQLFLYQEDLEPLCRELSAFDAFVSALMAVYKVAGLAENPLFDASWGSSLVPVQRSRLLQNRVKISCD